MPTVTTRMHTGTSQYEFSVRRLHRMRASGGFESHGQARYNQLRIRFGTMRVKYMKMTRQALVGSHRDQTATVRVLTLEWAGRPCGAAKGRD